MDKAQSDASKLHRTCSSRLRSVSTPEIPKRLAADTSMTTARTSLRPRTQSVLKRLPMSSSRMSLLPSHCFTDTSKETDTFDIELKLLYNEYLQAMMTEHIINKKVEEKKNAIVSQLASVAKELENDEEKLFRLTIRERDIKYLSAVQKELDSQIKEMNEYSKNDIKNTLKEILYYMYSLLKSLDTLPCNNILLPETTKEWEELQGNLENCVSVSQSIMELIGNKVDEYTATHDGIKKFIAQHSEILGCQKKLLEALSNLQVAVLKSAMHRL